MVEQQELDACWGQLVAKAWKDPAFKKRLLAQPAAVLKEEGIEMPAGVISATGTRIGDQLVLTPPLS